MVSLTHKAWLIRGYAIGMGAGTQVVTNLAWLALAGAPSEAPRALLMMAAGWVINLAVAEWIIRKGRPGHRLPRSLVWHRVEFRGRSAEVFRECDREFPR